MKPSKKSKKKKLNLNKETVQHLSTKQLEQVGGACHSGIDCWIKTWNQSDDGC